MKRRDKMTVWLAALPLVWALSGCGGGDEAKKTTPPAKPTTEKPTAEPGKTGGGAEATKGGEKPAAAVAGWGTIKGRVVCDGTPPEPKVVHKAGDQNVKNAEVCATKDMLSDDFVVNKDNKGVRWVFVWVNRPAAIHDSLKEATGKVEYGQQFCVFQPHALAYRKGQKLEVTSDDPVGHNTNMAPHRGTAPNPLIPAAEAGKKTILPGPDLPAQPRPFPVSCNIHSWMKGYIHVLDHPYFAVTDEKGEFTIDKVPAGKVSLVVWQERVEYGDVGRNGMEVEVKPDGEVELEIKLKPPAD